MQKIYIIPILLSSLLLFSCTRSSPSLVDLSMPTDQDQSIQPEQPLPNDVSVKLDTKYGPVIIKLFSGQAPKTVENFLAKAQSGFYNNLTFHRLVPGFVIQGGDPLGTGSGGGNIKSEINQTPFIRGSLGLARGNDKNVSNDSQFFICLTEVQCQHLTGDYVNFGQVESGMEYVDQLKVGDVIVSISVLSK